LILGFSIFFIGFFITFLITSILSVRWKNRCLGSYFIDPSFNGLRLLKKQEIKYHILAGIGNAAYTTTYMMLFQLLGDPSVVLPFTQVVIIYLIIVESFSEKDTPTLIEVQSAVIVTIGAILGSLSLDGGLNSYSLLLVFLVINPAWTLFSIYQRKLKRIKFNGMHNDAINIRFWNVTFSLAFILITTLFFDMIQDTSNLTMGIQTSFRYIHWIVVIVIGVFFAYVLYIRALGIGKASVSQAVRASTIIFSIPVSLFIATLGIIPYFSLDPMLLLIKGCGILLIILGILTYALTQVKAYIFITLDPNHDIYTVMNAIWHIRGVTHVSVITGSYDLIVKIQTRTLYKGYERIHKRIENIKGIKMFRWESVLKEIDIM